MNILDQIRKVIDNFQNKEWNIHNLKEITYSLEGAINWIDNYEEIDKNWVEKLRSEWWELELTSSLMIDNNEDSLTNEDIKVVKKALQNILSLISKIPH